MSCCIHLSHCRWSWLLIGILTLPILVGSRAAADDDAAASVDGSAPPALNKTQLTSQIEKLQADANLDAAVKKNAIEFLKTAVEDWNAASQAEQSQLRLQRQLETAAEELDTLRKKLASMPAKSTVSIPANADSEQLERQRDELERTLEKPETGLRERVSRLEHELSQRPERLKSINEQLLEAEDQLKETEEELKKLPDDPDSPVAAAHRLALRAAIYRYEQEMASIEAERHWLESADADRWIHVLQQIAERDVARVEDELEQVNERLEVQRKREAAERVEQARQDSLSVHPALKSWADENQQLAERSRKLTERLQAVEEEKDVVSERLEELEKESKEMRETVESVGRNDAIGLILRQQLAKLPDQRLLRRHVATREEDIREINLKKFEIERQQRETPEAEAILQSVRTASRSPAEGLDDGTLKSQAETVLKHREELLEQLERDYTRLFTNLADLALSERKLLTATQETARFYDEQMLWMRSGAVFGFRDIEHWSAAVRRVTAANGSQDLPSYFLLDLEHRPVIYLLAALAAWGWLLLGKRRRPRISTSEEQRLREFSLGTAAREAVLTAISAAFVPGLMAFAAWRLDQSTDGSAWLAGMSNGLWRCAAWVWPLIILRRACAADGLAVVHLAWTEEAARRISRRVTWFLPPSAVLMFTVGAMEIAKNDVVSDSLGRTAFLVLMGMCGLFCRGLLASRDQSPEALVKDPWKQRAEQFLYWTVPLAPWGLAIVAFAGYYDTALKLAGRLEATAWLWLILSGLQSSGSRWIAGEQQRLENLPDPSLSPEDVGQRLGDKRKSLFARLRASQAARGPSPVQMSRQMLVLLRTLVVVCGLTGLAAIWNDVLPAVVHAERWTLWETVATQQVADVGKDGNSSGVRTVLRLDPVTAVDVGLALLICGVTLIAARNIPALVEILFLERLPLDVGGRFAVTILVRYSLFVLGISLACGRINIGWRDIQWLIAAASVGLGFGLQDIFANFVSGIILLFERPIRVGDVITIGDTTGTVSQIRFRSTTILDHDRRELVVPNKDLITGKLLNWTLTDQINRIKLRVAVSNDADPNQIRQLLQEIALAHPIVLKDPSPTATLEELGANSLIFQLKAFLPSLDDRSKVIHELHSTIHTRLHANGIGTAPLPAAKPPASPTKGVAA